MTRKIFALIICAVMLLSASVQNVYASDYVFKSDFNDSGTSAGIGGKTEDDKSCNTKQDIYNIIALSGEVTFEYNLFHTTDYLNHLRFVYTTEEANNVTTNIFDTNGSGKFKFRSQANKVYSIPDNRWIRIALTFDPAISADNLTFYINGVQMGKGTIPLPKAQTTMLRAVFDVSNDYIDDIVAYYGSYSMTPPQISFDSVTAEADNTALTAQVSSMPVSDLKSKIILSDGAEFVGVADGETLRAKNGNEIVESGDKLMVSASDGMTYFYYTITTFGQYYSEDFVHASADEPDAVLPGGTSLNAVAAKIGIGGKKADDVSVVLPDSDSSVEALSADVGAYPILSFEYSILKTDDTPSNLLIGTETSFPAFEADGKITLGSAVIGSYQCGRWNRVAVEIKPSEGVYNYYLNGTCIAENIPFCESGNIAPVFSGKGSYVDDIRMYADSYVFKDAPEALAKGSARLDEINMQIALYSEADASEIADYVESADACAISVADFKDSTTKIRGKINTGDLIAVTSDNVIFNYYTVTDKIPEAFDAVKCVMISEDRSVGIADITSGMNVSFEYTMQNKTDEDKSGYLVIAVYENEALVYFDIQRATVSAGSTIQTNPNDCVKKSKSDYVAKEKPDHIEIQFWKSLTERTPLLKTYKFN